MFLSIDCLTIFFYLTYGVGTPAQPTASLNPNDSLFAHLGEPRRYFREAEWRGQTEALRQRFGKNKTYPQAYELPILLALSHYPELKDAHIDFVIRNRGAPISSWPVVGSLFRAKRNWRFRITIADSGPWANSPAIMKNMSFNAQIGAMGHEIAHTAHFVRKSFFGMVGLGFCFISKSFHKRFEQDTDRRAIDYGLGWQLYDWSREIRGGRIKNNPEAWLDQYYLSPESIAAYMQSHNGYAGMGSQE